MESHHQVQPSGALTINTPDSNRLTGQHGSGHELFLWKLVMTPTVPASCPFHSGRPRSAIKVLPASVAGKVTASGSAAQLESQVKPAGPVAGVQLRKHPLTPSDSSARSCWIPNGTVGCSGARTMSRRPCCCPLTTAQRHPRRLRGKPS